MAGEKAAHDRAVKTTAVTAKRANLMTTSIRGIYFTTAKCCSSGKARVVLAAMVDAIMPRAKTPRQQTTQH